MSDLRIQSMLLQMSGPKLAEAADRQRRRRASPLDAILGLTAAVMISVPLWFGLVRLARLIAN